MNSNTTLEEVWALFHEIDHKKSRMGKAHPTYR